MSARAVTAGFASIFGLTAFAAHAEPHTPYIETVVALEQCGQQSFSMIDDIRFGLFIVGASAQQTTLANATLELRAARQELDIDCTLPAVQDDMRAFTADVLPKIRSVR